MDKALSYAAYALVAPFQLAQGARKSRAQVTTDQYLQNLSETSLLASLGDFLAPLVLKDDHVEQIFDKFATPSGNGASIWNESSFASFFAVTNGDTGASSGFVSILWRLFTSAGYFPVHHPGNLSTETVVELDRDGFTRAFALLVADGFTFLGYKRDLHVSFIQKENEPSRNARFVQSCLVRPSGSAVDGPREDWRAESILDVVYLAQPPTYEGTLASTQSTEEKFKDAAQHVMTSIREPPNLLSVTPQVQREDLHSLLSLLLLVSLEDRIWRQGVTATKGTGPMAVRSAYTSETVLYSSLILSADGVNLAHDLARGIVKRYFDQADESISLGSLERYCREHPTFMLFFSHIGASIFSTVGSASRSSLDDSMAVPTPVANALSLLNVARFYGRDERDADPRAFDVQFNVDLRAAQQVPIDHIRSSSESPLTTGSSAVALEQVLTHGQHFHMLVISTLDRLVAIFVTPRDDPQLQIWRARRDGARGHVKYSWRSSYVQLRPEVVGVDAGPVHVVAKEDRTADDDERVLVLETHRDDGSASHDRSPVRVARVRLDFNNHLFTATGDDGTGRVESLEWTAIQCYRMPEVASRVTTGS